MHVTILHGEMQNNTPARFKYDFFFLASASASAVHYNSKHFVKSGSRYLTHCCCAAAGTNLYVSWGRVIRRHGARHGVVKQAEKSQIGLINRVLERQAEENVK